MTITAPVALKAPFFIPFHSVVFRKVMLVAQTVSSFTSYSKQNPPSSKLINPDFKEQATCGDAVSAIPICADTTWDLWVNSGQWPFCCLEGSIGYRTPGGIWGAGSLCAVAGVPVPSSVLASSVRVYFIRNLGL